MQFLSRIQTFLEERYGARTGIDVRDFVRPIEKLDRKGEMLVEQASNEADLNLALLLDRDILSAWEAGRALAPAELAVPFEEVSHFVYLSWNHARGRNVTPIEMEMQSEVDRILLAFHGGWDAGEQNRHELLDQLLHAPYASESYETARRAAAGFVRRLGGDPRAWTKREFAALADFFHSDLARKLHLSRP